MKQGSHYEVLLRIQMFNFCWRMHYPETKGETPFSQTSFWRSVTGSSVLTHQPEILSSVAHLWLRSTWSCPSLPINTQVLINKQLIYSKSHPTCLCTKPVAQHVCMWKWERVVFQRSRTSRIYIAQEIYFKELVHAIVEASKSKIRRSFTQAGGQERNLCSTSSPRLYAAKFPPA